MTQGGSFGNWSPQCSAPRKHIYYWSVLILWVRGRGPLPGRERLALGAGLSCTPVWSGAAEQEEQSLQLSSGADWIPFLLSRTQQVLQDAN